MTLQVEIIAIGQEILLGDTQDTNSHWLCGQITHLGGMVRRVTQIADEPAVMAELLQAARQRRNDLILTTGGLGPTEDDRTLAAVADAFGLGLEADEQALALVRERYRTLTDQGHLARAGMTPSRGKMAHLPQGAEPLPNEVGAAPGAWLELEGLIVISLPGVPDELKALFEAQVLPRLQTRYPDSHYEQWQARVACGDETVLAPLLRDVAARHPNVYIKSRARRFAAEVQFLVTLSARGEGRETVRSLLEAAWKALDSTLADHDIQARKIEPAQGLDSMGD